MDNAVTIILGVPVLIIAGAVVWTVIKGIFEYLDELNGKDRM